ncbi:hypothetical protein K435DRAFT_402518 [Dendrothele bispora CBS 962.96]|uniref:Uncharacterized protein n=1 Tax=Dendrothele bispora (strain CBS 962.96) TaxID=1314807 RepID=A0A4V4HH56_DENBC|nr:hypothetical protein K435DRAFT_402518 [Dendrothele bispora CBS 962.96]
MPGTGSARTISLFSLSPFISGQPSTTHLRRCLPPVLIDLPRARAGQVRHRTETHSPVDRRILCITSIISLSLLCENSGNTLKAYRYRNKHYYCY